MKKCKPANFIYILAIILLTTSCWSSETPKKSPRPLIDMPQNTNERIIGEIIFNDEYDEEFFNKAKGAGLGMGIFPESFVRGYSPESLDKLIDTFMYEGGDIFLDVDLLVNTKEDPLILLMLVLNDGIPVRFKLFENEFEEYSKEYMLYGEEAFEDMKGSGSLTPQFSLKDTGRLDIFCLPNSRSTEAWVSFGHSMMFYVEKFPESYFYHTPDVTKLKPVPADEENKQRIKNNDKPINYFSPIQKEPRYTTDWHQIMRLGGVRQVDCTFLSGIPGAHRTFFVLNGEPILNHDGSVHLVEWEGGPDVMHLYTLDLDGMSVEGRNLFFSVTLPLQDIEYQRISCSPNYALFFN